MENLTILIPIAIIICILGYLTFLVKKDRCAPNPYRSVMFLTHGDIFKFELKCNARLKSIMLAALNDNKEIDAVIIEVITKEPKENGNLDEYNSGAIDAANA